MQTVERVSASAAPARLENAAAAAGLIFCHSERSEESSRISIPFPATEIHLDSSLRSE
jgi:hypothetical protein